MKEKLLTLLCLYLIPNCESRALRGRARRQAEEPKPESYQLPFYAPYPGRDASVLSPVFPFVGHYDMGLEIDDGEDSAFDGFLNIPIPGWGIWDLKGGFESGASTTHVGFGLLGSPINALGLSPETVVALGANPDFQAARNAGPELPVAVLPGGYVPLRCKPPFCNPFIHNLGVGVEVEPGGDPEFNGGLDFPIPLGPYGLGSRFPLSGGFNGGTFPFAVNYGHKLGPVDPFGAQATTTKAPPLIPFTAWPGIPPVPAVGATRPPVPAGVDPTDPFAGFPFPVRRRFKRKN